MNVKIAVISAAVAVFGVACGDGQGDLGVDEVTSALNPSDAGGKWYGSDTLKNATLTAEGTGKAGTTLKYQGKGSGVGEACMRNGIGSAVNGTTFCATLPNTATAPYQVLAPMSRDLKATQGDGGACIGGGATDSSGCCTGERSNVVALDGVDVWVKATNTATDIGLADLKKLFCGNADSDGGIYPTGCVTKFGDGGIEFTLGDAGSNGTVAAWELYVRNDESGTTDAFQTLVGCKNKVGSLEPFVYCPGIGQVTDAKSSTTYPTILRFDNKGKAGTAVNATVCGLGVDATVCIGKLVEQDTSSIGYAGGSALDGTNNRALSVNTILPTAANIRLLLTGGTGVYPLARKLFLNENIKYTADTQEAKYYNWIYGKPGGGGAASVANNKQAYENVLTAQDFVSCKAPQSDGGALNAMNCNVGVCFGYDGGGTAINDGRGTGNCKAAAPATNKTCVR
jgi:phosphate transport system substrate-binding protein